jgi:hypothetical protein
MFIHAPRSEQTLTTHNVPSLRRCRCGSLVSFVVLIGVVWIASAQRAESQTFSFKAPEVQAVFLFNIAQFAEWPASAFPDRHSAFVIGILGDDPFGRVLDDVVEGEVVGGRTLVVERFRRVEDIGACQILFVGLFGAAEYAHIFASLERRPILTVGDSEGFATRGGAIGFVTAQNKIRLRVNLNAVVAANVKISSNLLRSAEIVAGERPR